MDNEVSGNGNSYDYGFRIYNPRIAKFLSVDPLTKSYPWYTPYQFAGNKPIWAIDLDGLEEYVVHKHVLKSARGKPVLWKMDYLEVDRGQRLKDFKEGYYFEDEERAVKGGTEYEKQYFIKKRSLIKKFEPVNLFNKIKRDGHKSGTEFLDYRTGISFEQNQGRNVAQVQTAFDEMSGAQKDHFDAMVAVLVNDPDATMIVSGFASPRATSMDGELPNSSTENNKILAKARAQAGMDFITKYAMDNYGTDISDRVKTESTVRNSTPEDGDDAACQGDQSIGYKIKRNND